MDVAVRPYGPLRVFPVALGAGHIGGPDQDDAEIGRLLNEAVDAGVNLFDTALSYGSSEDRLRRHLGARRREILLSTKVGYGVPGHADWTPSCIREGVDQALRHLGCDYLDIVHLHSCPENVLSHGGVVEPLLDAVTAGKVRVAGYSGDNDALAWAVDSGAFGGVQASYSVVDVANRPAIDRARASGVGVLVKRPLANAVWRFDHRPEPEDQRLYWDRWRALDLPDLGIPWAEVALRFALASSGAAACLVGTSRLAHLRSSIEALERGPLPTDVVDVIESRLRAAGADWPAMI